MVLIIKMPLFLVLIFIRAISADDFLDDLENLAKGIFDDDDSSEEYTTHPTVTKHPSSEAIKIVALLTYLIAMAIAIYALYKYKCKKMCQKEPEQEVLPRSRSNSFGSEVSVTVVHTPDGAFVRRLSETLSIGDGSNENTSRNTNNRRGNRSGGTNPSRRRSSANGGNSPSNANNMNVNSYNTFNEDPPPSYDEVMAKDRETRGAT